MQELILLSVFLRAFKGKNLKLDFNSDKTQLLGRNNSGKSIIEAAVIWALTGEIFYGDKSAIVSKGDLSTSVTVNVLLNGIPNTITRELKVTGTGFSGVIRFNHIETTQSQYEEYLGIPMKLLYVLLCPMAFWQMSSGDKTKLFYSLSPNLIENPIKHKWVSISNLPNVLKDIDGEIANLQEFSEAIQNEISEAKQMFPTFESFDLELSRKFRGKLDSFCAAKSSELFGELTQNHEVNLEIEALKKYIKIPDASLLQSQISESLLQLEQIEEQKKQLSTYKEQISLEGDKILSLSESTLATYNINLSLVKTAKLSVKDIFSEGLSVLSLSGSERISLSIGLHRAFQDLFGFSSPLFVDSAESIVGEEALDDISKDIQLISLYAAPTELAKCQDEFWAAEILTSSTIPRTPLWKIRSVEVR